MTIQRKTNITRYDNDTADLNGRDNLYCLLSHSLIQISSKVKECER